MKTQQPQKDTGSKTGHGTASGAMSGGGGPATKTGTGGASGGMNSGAGGVAGSAMPAEKKPPAPAASKKTSDRSSH